MYNTGYQHWLAIGATSFPFWQLFGYGFLALLPRLIVSYVVGLGIEFVVAQWRKEEIQERFPRVGNPYPADIAPSTSPCGCLP